MARHENFSAKSLLHNALNGAGALRRAAGLNDTAALRDSAGLRDSAALNAARNDAAVFNPAAVPYDAPALRDASALNPAGVRIDAAVLRDLTPLPDFSTRSLRATRPGVALALGGGFARGFAHLGVLQVFEENHIAISHIAGTSVGSILGAAYASGAPLALIMATCRTLRFRDIARWNVSRLGLASNHRLADLIERVFKSSRFEDLKIPMAVVATNLNTGEPVVFTEGSLIDPIRASCAFPGIFEPVEIGTRWLVDGGLTAPVPTRAAREIGARYVVGVSVGMQDGHDGKPSSIFQVVSRSVCAAQKHQLELWERHADLVIRPDVQSLAWDDFDRAEEAIEAGKIAATRALPRIRKLLGNVICDEGQEPGLAHPTEFRDSGLHFITEAMGS
jgi:NTE family protein